MNVNERESGLLVPSEPRPEHPARKNLRDALANLANELGEFEQTTHGMLGPFDIESVARHLVECYERPTAYSISSLSQVIRGMRG
jgi:hypothetical protein